MTDGRWDRRRFLAGLAGTGTATVAGCSDLLGNSDAGPTFTPDDAVSVITDAAPTVEWPVPVVPASSAVDEGLERIDALLAAVPDPLEETTVPNGVVRKSITDRRNDARDHRAEAARATGDGLYHGLHATREARENARAAAATFAAIDDEQLLEDVLTERRDVRPRARTRLEDVAYRGDDTDDERLRAALLYARLESDLEDVSRRLGDRHWDVQQNANVVEIGRGAGQVESGIATVDVWDHLRGRHEDRLDEPTDLTSIFEAALEASIDRVEALDLPARLDHDWLERTVDADLDDHHRQHALWHAADRVSSARDGIRGTSAEGTLGDGLYEAVRFERQYRAFERVRERVESGAFAVPDTADGIRDERAAAIDAAVSARESITRPSIGAYALEETLQSLEWTDDRVRRAADSDPDTVVSLATEYGEYVRLRAQFEVLPDAVAAFRERLLS